MSHFVRRQSKKEKFPNIHHQIDVVSLAPSRGSGCAPLLEALWKCPTLWDDNGYKGCIQWGETNVADRHVKQSIQFQSST